MQHPFKLSFVCCLLSHWLTAFMTIYSRKPMHSAIYLLICFTSISGHYLLLNAQFLAMVNLIVYIGAIMILIVFTIMLMNLNKENEVHKPRVTRLGAIVLFCLMCLVLIAMFINSKPIVGELYHNWRRLSIYKSIG